jgi:hypothetical protein
LSHTAKKNPGFVPPQERRFFVQLPLALSAALVLRLAWFVFVMRNSAIESGGRGGRVAEGGGLLRLPGITKLA